MTTSESSHMMIIDRIVRNKIFGCRYWKEECFGLTAESLVDKAIELQYVGGTYGGPRKPTAFICLIAKLLQINPEKEIIFEFIKNKDYKYVNILALFYLRLIGKPMEVYQILELFYSDYRKIRVRQQDGTFTIQHVDEIIEQMLGQETVFDVLLPRIPKRILLEEQELPPRKSAIEDELVLEEEEEEPQISQNQGLEVIEEVDERERSKPLEIGHKIKKEKKDKKAKKEKKEKKEKKKDKSEQKEKKKKFKFKKHKKESDEQQMPENQINVEQIKEQ